MKDKDFKGVKVVLNGIELECKSIINYQKEKPEINQETYQVVLDVSKEDYTALKKALKKNY